MEDVRRLVLAEKVKLQSFFGFIFFTFRVAKEANHSLQVFQRVDGKKIVEKKNGAQLVML